jgi:hypothetical protein
LGNIKVTDRDLRLLLDLYKNTFLSLYQIRDRHFIKCARSTIYNRLSMLIKGELIESMRVNLNAVHKRREDIGAVYYVTTKGFGLMIKYHQGSIKRTAPVPINLNQLHHDLILTDAIKKLEKQFIDTQVVNSKLLLNSFKEERQVPDAEMIFDNKKYALEVELTAKSNMRYRDIISNYRTSSKFDKVLYLVKDEGIQNKIGAVVTGLQGNYKKTDDTDKFYFCTLSNFFNEPEEKRFSNGASCLNSTINTEDNNFGRLTYEL